MLRGIADSVMLVRRHVIRLLSRSGVVRWCRAVSAGTDGEGVENDQRGRDCVRPNGCSDTAKLKVAHCLHRRRRGFVEHKRAVI